MWAARLEPALHTPHGLVFSKSLLGPQEPSRKTYPTQNMLIFHEKGRFFAFRHFQKRVMYVFIVFKLCAKTFVYTENDDVQVFRMYQCTARRLFKAMLRLP